jgi:hypothetical protein
VLLRSWIKDAGLSGRTSWVSIERPERDAQRFWLPAIESLHATVGGGDLVVLW